MNARTEAVTRAGRSVSIIVIWQMTLVESLVLS